LSEPEFGVSLLTDARYGYSTFESTMGLSLVRGTVSPDPNADIGRHRFRYALFPHAGDWRQAGTVGQAARFNRPILWAKGAPSSILGAPLVSIEPANVAVDTIKPAEDGSGWVVRLYECAGGSCTARLSFGVPVKNVHISNTLEDPLQPVPMHAGAYAIPLRPFQIATLRLDCERTVRDG